MYNVDESHDRTLRPACCSLWYNFFAFLFPTKFNFLSPTPVIMAIKIMTVKYAVDFDGQYGLETKISVVRKRKRERDRENRNSGEKKHKLINTYRD
jgi:hypothetical protein